MTCKDCESTSIIKAYVETRDAVLDCQMAEKAFSCETCPKHHTEDKEGNITGYCYTRQAYIQAYNNLNAVANPDRPDASKLPPYDKLCREEA